MVAVDDGWWSALDLTKGDRAQWRPIVERVADEPLTVIEDVTAHRTFFLHDGIVYDVDGTEKLNIEAETGEQKLLSLANFVWSVRKK